MLADVCSCGAVSRTSHCPLYTQRTPEKQRLHRDGISPLDQSVSLTLPQDVPFNDKRQKIDWGTITEATRHRDKVNRIINGRNCSTAENDGKDLQNPQTLCWCSVHYEDDYLRYKTITIVCLHCHLELLALILTLEEWKECLTREYCLSLIG